MDIWSEIKSKILFSYLGCDWTSTRVSETSVEDIKTALNEVVSLVEKETNSIYTFEVAQVTVAFYTNSDQHLDFDPKDIVSINQWTLFLDFFKILSKKLNGEILFRPEDSDYESKESVLVLISGNDVVYNFDIKAGYDDD
ncbi:MAG: hypothetical protein HC913_21765 [Microscillaceae bacterium]|nr:hypothetical protein [Microscillaceae bacterium]